MLKKFIHKLDELWANVVKNKADYQCEHCGIRGIRMEAAHVVGRRYRATRWGCWFDPEPRVLGPRVVARHYDLCGHCLCHNCHQQYDEHGPLEGAIVDKTIGSDRLERIQHMATQSVVKDQDYEQITEWLMGYEEEKA